MTDERQGPARIWPWMLAVLLIAGAAFAIGRFSTFGVAQQTATPTSDSAEAGFARDMQVHHAQAVEMAMQVYRTTDDDTVRALSYDIATGQSAQKGEMYDWLVQWGLPQADGPLMSWMATSDEHAGHGDTEQLSTEELEAQMGMATDAELAELNAATGTEADCLFLGLMIRHHEGAVPMAEAVIELGSQPRVLQFAQAVIETQTAEIDAMQSAQARLGCTG
ncbi:DUF305 domain-containing protein [Microbacterium fluvii]|uniref:DUF305 domain-containing protein n=1 Tax=Microbacterium fluvii TaxID=415215 RepID=A0ABW2HE12_9MICO|nr:DUF305 domain-containing protein [Microbacterium fluvii]MCU4671629.1 DUF305 domain-containing protein [Microbacterium fluvii]